MGDIPDGVRLLEQQYELSVVDLARFLVKWGYPKEMCEEGGNRFGCIMMAYLRQRVNGILDRLEAGEAGDKSSLTSADEFAERIGARYFQADVISD